MGATRCQEYPLQSKIRFQITQTLSLMVQSHFLTMNLRLLEAKSENTFDRPVID